MKQGKSSKISASNKTSHSSNPIKVSLSKVIKINSAKKQQRCEKSNDNRLKRVDTWKPEDREDFKRAFIKVTKKDNLFFDAEIDSLDAITRKIYNNLSEGSSRTELHVKSYLIHYIRRIHHYRAQHDDAIDKWAEVFDAVSPQNKDLEQQLTSAIMVAAEEPIPSFTKDNIRSARKETRDGDNSNKSDLKMPEPDYNAVYNYLACAVSGATLPNLSSIDSLLIEDCIQSLAEQIKSLDDGDLRLNLRFIYLYLNKSKGQAPEEEEDEVINQLSKGTLYNPLGLDENLIMPVPPK